MYFVYYGYDLYGYAGFWLEGNIVDVYETDLGHSYCNYKLSNGRWFLTWLGSAKTSSRRAAVADVVNGLIKDSIWGPL